jgi:hypothetical protein
MTKLQMTDIVEDMMNKIIGDNESLRKKIENSNKGDDHNKEQTMNCLYSTIKKNI